MGAWEQELTLRTLPCRLSGPNGEIPGVQTDDGVGTIFFSFAPLALDETARGSYQITVVPQDGVGNRGAAQMFSFTYQPTAPILAGTQLRFVSASRSVDFEDGAKFAEPPSQITVTLTDQSGTGVNFEASFDSSDWAQRAHPWPCHR